MEEIFILRIFFWKNGLPGDLQKIEQLSKKLKIECKLVEKTKKFQ
jgi:hypothetical protein